MKPRILDLFCGAGGAAVGLHRAGFDVVGVDIKPQTNYPFEFHQADALKMSDLDDFDAYWASPPCQRFSRITHVSGNRDEHQDCIVPIRYKLIATNKPWIIENVVGAPLSTIITLCGSMFHLGANCHDGVYRQLRRHRNFESNVMLLQPGCQHYGEPIGVYGHGGGQFKTVWNGGINRGYMGSFNERQEAMGIDWMTRAELTESIPPAYSEYLGRQLIAYIKTSHFKEV